MRLVPWDDGGRHESRQTITTHDEWPGNRRAPLIGLETYDPEAAIAVLESFLEQDADEHRAALEFLMEALDEERPEGLKIFPER